MILSNFYKDFLYFFQVLSLEIFFQAQITIIFRRDFQPSKNEVFTFSSGLFSMLPQYNTKPLDSIPLDFLKHIIMNATV